MLDKNEIAALKSIADDLAAFSASQEIALEQRVLAEKKFQALITGNDWEKKRAYYDEY